MTDTTPRAFLEALLQAMHIEVERIDEMGDAEHRVFLVVTNDSQKLIGHQGETLRALNHLVRKAFEDKLPPEELHFRIDVNGYFADRDGRIVREARQLAERARLFKYDIDMRPLNPYERRIVHEALQDFPDIVTESRGEGTLRHIVICYKPGGTAAAATESSPEV